MPYMKTTKKIVGASVGLGLGAAVVGGIPGGGAAMPIISKSVTMMGPLTTAAYGADTIKVLNKSFKQKKKY